MNIEVIKNQIENKTIDDSLLIFLEEDKGNDFIPFQYINEIANFKMLQVRSIEEEELKEVAMDVNAVNLFGSSPTEYLYVYKVKKGNLDVDKYKEKEIELTSCKNLCIICNGVTDNTKSLYSSFIVNVPKLEQWQIYDYAYSKAPGTGDKELNYLVSSCGGDIYRLDNELNKLTIFNQEERNAVFQEFYQDGMFSDMVGDTIFNFTNALIDKDFQTISRLYPHIDSLGVEDMVLLSILMKNIRNIILVILQPNPNPDNTFGLSLKQIGYLKRYKQKFNDTQLYKAFNFLTDIDRKIKSGLIDTRILVDYLIAFMLTL